MKLTSVQVEQTLTQVEAQAIPDNHPLVRQLNDLFGDHTFFLDRHGLSIVEPAADSLTEGSRAARVVNLANWTDGNLTSLAPHDPVVTDAVVDIGAKA
jgi:hypothetical protein